MYMYRYTELVKGKGQKDNHNMYYVTQAPTQIIRVICSIYIAKSA